jgi:hypothetical protein
LLGTLTCADLVLGDAYFNERRKCLIGERDSAVTSRLQEIYRTHLLLRQINAGKADDAARALNEKLSDDIRGLDSLLASANEATRTFAGVVYKIVAHAGTKQPGPERPPSGMAQK